MSRRRSSADTTESAGGRNQVVVVTGAGGMGEAVARRLGPGRILILADASEEQLVGTAERLEAAGHRVRTLRVDVSLAADVTALAATAAALGAIRAVVHTAGVSPVQATPAQIVAVDVVGTARVLYAFAPYVEPGSPGIIATPMGRAELAGPFGDVMRAMLDQSGSGRIGWTSHLASKAFRAGEPVFIDTEQRLGAA